MIFVRWILGRIFGPNKEADNNQRMKTEINDLTNNQNCKLDKITKNRLAMPHDYQRLTEEII